MTTTSPTSETHYDTDELEELTETMQILSSPRRIRTLLALHGETEIRRTELVSKVVQLTYADAGERITAQKRKRELISLYQNHLAKLENVGALNWRRDTDIIRPGENYEDIMATFWWAMAVLRST